MVMTGRDELSKCVRIVSQIPWVAVTVAGEGSEEDSAVAVVLLPAEDLPVEEVSVVATVVAVDMEEEGTLAAQPSVVQLHTWLRHPTHPIPSPTSQPLVVNVVLRSMCAM
jgi:hypothetical protein